MVQTGAGVEQEVRAADAERVRALLTNDFEALERLLGDDLVYTHSNGRQDTKETYIGGLREGRSRYLSMDMRDETFRVFGDSAVVNSSFTARVQTPNGEVSLNSRALIIYTKRDGRWQFVAWSSTPIANP